MEERRGYFRVRNPGMIQANYEGKDLNVVDMSLSGAMLKPGDTALMSDGIIEIVINHFSIKIHYDLLRQEGDNVVVTFRMDEKNESLLSALKNVRMVAEKHHQTQNWHADHPVIEQISRLDSLYAVRLYSLLHQYVHVGHETVQLDYLRLALGIDNVKAYNTYKQLQDKILVPAINEINKKTGILASFTNIIEDNKVVAVKFTLLPGP